MSNPGSRIRAFRITCGASKKSLRCSRAAKNLLRRSDVSRTTARRRSRCSCPSPRGCAPVDRGGGGRPVPSRTSGPSAAEPVTFHRTTVSGCTSTTAVRQFRQVRDKAIQKSRSRAWRCRRPVARFIAVSCCRSAGFSKTNSRYPRSANASARPITISRSSMRRSWLASARKSTGTSSGRGSRSSRRFASSGDVCGVSHIGSSPLMPMQVTRVCRARRYAAFTPVSADGCNVPLLLSVPDPPT